ncbi:pyridoxal phosphate-dependent aminotransferase [Clostridium sp. 19966]|uniref:pyridoxal phosphate-dependent aminotransferase n=1 Tax=Clostridium sp. 19966 TaxID=2768166 RepID=UPI0028DDEE81|nr:pyridoxal phosphate-dependent aminotransferase [Clostridium sp. 19966]MDT8716402.1 pyridoxal phosphate-dependent aminotransferase [Clostridium sp. 19966]
MEFSNLASKLQPSITLEITAKANEMKKNGIDVISFGAGEPDFNTPQNIIEAAKSAMDNGFTKYTPSSGIIELKQEIVKKFKRDNNLDYGTSQIIVSTGAKQCLSNVFQAILNKDDEIIINKPCWVTYPELISLYGGVPVYVDTDEKDSFKYKLDNLEAAVTSKTKAIIINSPNNPTGAVYSKKELEMIASFAEKYNLIIISDEIYEKLIYGDSTHISIASLSQDAYNRTVVINGFSKTYSMTGWRIGYAAGAKEIIKLMGSIQSHTTSNVNSITQYASVEALSGPQDTIAYMKEQFNARRDYMVDRIKAIPYVTCVRPEGAFYVMLKVKDLYGKYINGESILNSTIFSSVLLEEAKVAVVPGAAFGADDYIRLSYATSMDNIKNGLDRIEKFIKKIVI